MFGRWWTSVVGIVRRKEDPAAVGVWRAHGRRARGPGPQLESSGDEADVTQWTRAAVAILQEPAAMADSEQVNHAVRLLRDAVEMTSESSPDLAGRLSNLAGALHQRHNRWGGEADLDESVAFGRRALAVTTADDPHLAIHASNLAAALTTRYELRHDLDDLVAAITEGRRILDVTEPVDPRLPGRLSNMCSALRQHWERTGSRTSLNEAITIGQRGASLAAAGHPQRAAVLSNLSTARQQRHGATGNLDDLLAAVEAGEECVALTAALTEDDGNAAGRLSNVASMLSDLYERTGELTHLERALNLAARAATLPSASRNPVALLACLAGCLILRFEATGDPTDLTFGIEAARGALAAAPKGHPARSGALLALSNALQTQAEATDSADGFDEATALVAEAIDALPQGHPHLGLLHNGLGVALRLRFDRQGHPEDVERAVCASQTAVDLLRVTRAGASTASALANLSASLQARYEYGGQESDLERGAECAREAVMMTSRGDLAYPRLVSALVSAIRLQVETSGDSGLSDEMVGYARDAVDATPRPGELRASRLVNLSVVARARAERRAALTDVNDAVRWASEARDLLVPGRPLRSEASSALGLALATRYELTGRTADLDEAARQLGAAVDESPTWRADRARHLSNYGGVLHTRFELTGAAVDLDAAVEVLEASVDATAASDTRRAGRLANLSGALRARYLIGARRADADAAVASARAALTAIPAHHVDRASYLTKLSLALTASLGGATDQPADSVPYSGRAEARAEAAVLREARELVGEAVQVTSPASPSYLGRLSNEAGLLLQLFERTGAMADLDESLALVERAVELTPPGHPDLAVYLSNLGRARYARFVRTGEQADQAAAQTAYATAARLDTATPTARAGAARAWAIGAAEMSDWSTATQAGELAIEMLSRTVGRGLTRPDQQRRLTSVQGLGSLVAACALADGMPERAVELLDQARGVLLGRIGELRTDVGQLAQTNPDLAGRIEAVRRALDAPTDDLAREAGAPRRLHVDDAQLQQHRRDLAAQFEALLAEARQLPGYARFLLPPDLSQMRDAAGAGPVVIINPHRIRCDALVLTRAGVHQVRLAHLSAATAGDQVLALTAAVATATDSTVDLNLRTAAEERINAVLRWLWDSIAEPVLSLLDQRRVWDQYGGVRRLWWCPTGVLAFLPLHAAGHQIADPATDAVGGQPRTVLDRVVSSYTPTIRALLDSRRPPNGAVGSAASGSWAPEITAVALPKTPERKPLPNATREASMIAEAFPGRVQTLTGPQASRERVLAAMVARPWIHLACHGVTDIDEPSNSALLVYDHQHQPLTVADIVRRRVDVSGLAYLSACGTAEPSVRLLDESIHLASAFQAAGYRHVIATLWTVWDLAALRVARSVYRQLRDAEADSALGPAAASAQALYDATLAARARDPDRPSAWASFVHYGP